MGEQPRGNPDRGLQLPWGMATFLQTKARNGDFIIYAWILFCIWWNEKKNGWYAGFFYANKTQKMALSQEQIPAQSVRGEGQAGDESFGVTRNNPLGGTDVWFRGGDHTFQTRISTRALCAFVQGSEKFQKVVCVQKYSNTL